MKLTSLFFAVFVLLGSQEDQEKFALADVVVTDVEVSIIQFHPLIAFSFAGNITRNAAGSGGRRG